jgi:hypothetical protein
LARVLQRLIVAAALAAIWLTAQQPVKPPLKFSHAVHAKLGDVSPILKAARKSGAHLRPEGAEPGIGCQACHAGVTEDQPKRGLAMMGDCLVCHPKTDPPFSCAFCHSGDKELLKPASHSPDFLDKHTAGLAKLNLSKPDCAVCHGRKFTCLGCH